MTFDASPGRARRHPAAALRTLVCSGLLASGSLAVSLVAPQAMAAEYPSKPMRLVVPFPAGGGGDTLARLVMTRVESELGQPIVVENLPGAGGNIGSASAARAAPDGYTLLYGTNGTFAINHALYKSPGFSPKDFTPVSQLTQIGALFVVRPNFPAASVADLIAQAKANPGKFTAASAGNGTTSHLALELLNTRAGTQILHIPYRGGALAIADVMGGQVDMMIDVIPNTAPQVKGGRVTALAVSTAERVPGFENVPTMQEAGVKGYAIAAWDGIFVPAGTPMPVVQRLESAIHKVLADPALQAQLRERGAQVAPSSPADFTTFVQAEMKRWGDVVQQSGARID